jgi:hypothetical protein
MVSNGYYCGSPILLHSLDWFKGPSLREHRFFFIGKSLQVSGGVPLKQSIEDMELS